MRVVSGDLGGRRLRTRAGSATRPTSERARAGLFDALGARVVGARVLDVCAGAGSLGIEALSRAAKSATFVESDRAAAAVLRANLADLGLRAGSRVLIRDARRALADLERSGARFDLVLMDPPYGRRLGAQLLGSAALSGLLAPGASVILERSLHEPEAEAPRDLAHTGTRRYGETCFDWYEHAEEIAG